MFVFPPIHFLFSGYDRYFQVCKGCKGDLPILSRLKNVGNTLFQTFRKLHKICFRTVPYNFSRHSRTSFSSYLTMFLKEPRRATPEMSFFFGRGGACGVMVDHGFCDDALSVSRTRNNNMWLPAWSPVRAHIFHPLAHRSATITPQVGHVIFVAVFNGANIFIGCYYKNGGWKCGDSSRMFSLHLSPLAL